MPMGPTQQSRHHMLARNQGSPVCYTPSESFLSSHVNATLQI